MVLNLITTFGTSAVAANAIANSVAGVINVPGMALGLAIITVIGQCMGAGETGQAVYYTKRLVGASYLCMLVMSAALFFSAGGLVTLFHLSPEACTMAAQVLRACAVGNVLFWPLAFTLPNSLRAAGDAIFTMAVSLGSMFVCRVVLSYVFACAWGLNLGLLGVWLAMIADWVVRAAFFLAGQMETHPRDLTAQGGNRMERFQDPERLAALFARCRIPERLPWTAAYPWTLQYYEKGEYLCRLREPMESLYLLLEGGIQTSLTNAAGRTRLVATAQPGELVGGDVEVVLGNVQATTDQRAQEDGALCAALPLAEYREALCSDLGFLRYASRRLARIVVMNTFRATNDLLLPLENRLAAYLLSQAEDGWFHGTLTRTAETLSTSYRQLTRVMSRFAQAGYLRRTPEGWRLEEPDALQALAESVEPSRIL